MPVFEKCGNIRNDDSQNVKRDKIRATRSAKKQVELPFDGRPEKIKGQHIPKKVYVVLVNKAGRHKAVVLPLTIGVVRIHHKGRQHGRCLEGIQAYQGGDADDDVGEIQMKKLCFDGKHNQFHLLRRGTVKNLHAGYFQVTPSAQRPSCNLA